MYIARWHESYKQTRQQIICSADLRMICKETFFTTKSHASELERFKMRSGFQKGWLLSCSEACARTRFCGDVQLGLAELCEAVEGNFLDIPFPEETFDAAYAIEATCHAAKVTALVVAAQAGRTEPRDGSGQTYAWVHWRCENLVASVCQKPD